MYKILLFIAAIIIVSPAWADDICTDRPGLGSNPCTVPAGHWQVESDIVNGTWDHKQGNSITILDPTIKLGISPAIDLELTLTPYVNVRSTPGLASGIGDTYLKAKWQFLQTDKLSAAVISIVKVPTARSSIGNGVWESGVQIPATFTINPKWSISHTSELDLVKNAANNKTHIQIQDSITVGRTWPAQNITVQAGVGTIVNYDSKIVRQLVGSISSAWIVNHTTQWDAGINLGLNRNTPAIQFYTGFSERF